MRDEYQEHWLKEHRWKVAGTTVAVLAIITTWVIKWGQQKDREDSARMVQDLEEHLRNPPPPPVVMPEDPPPAPPAPPLRYVVMVAGQVVDLIGEAAFDAGGIAVVVRELPRARFASGGLGFNHATGVSVSRQADGAVVATIEGASLTLAPIDRGGQVSPGFPGTGAEAGPAETVTRTIAGADRQGERHRRSSGAVVETFAIELVKRPLSVVLYRDGESREVAALEEILASLAPAQGARAAAFEVVLDADPKGEVAPEEAVRLGEDKKARLVVQPRPTIRRAVGAISFEHPWALAVSPVASEVASVAVLRGRQVAIRLVALPMAIGVKAARSSLLGTAEAREDGDVEATFEGDTVRGKRFALSGDIGDDVVAELFVLRRGSKHIGVAVIYRSSERDAAIVLSDPVLSSVQ